jgi:hypothetical protein
MDSFLLMFVLWLGLAAVCAIVARWKNMNPWYWFGKGLLFGAFSLFYLLMTPGE